jgi:hypothetical protein
MTREWSPVKFATGSISERLWFREKTNVAMEDDQKIELYCDKAAD